LLAIQFQYAVFGIQWTRHNLPYSNSFLCAYYFDNDVSYQSHGLAAYIGLSVSPQSYFKMIMKTITLSYSAILVF
jgi:hypothetical protein